MAHKCLLGETCPYCRAEAAEARIAELEGAILRIHPAGADGNADPMEVLKYAEEDIQREMCRGPDSPIKFMDGDVEREIIYEVFEDSEGYVISENCEPFDELQSALTASQARVAELVGALGEIQKSLPTDWPSLDKPWSVALAIIDEALASDGSRVLDVVKAAQSVRDDPHNVHKFNHLLDTLAALESGDAE